MSKLQHSPQSDPIIYRALRYWDEYIGTAEQLIAEVHIKRNHLPGALGMGKTQNSFAPDGKRIKPGSCHGVHKLPGAKKISKWGKDKYRVRVSLTEEERNRRESDYECGMVSARQNPQSNVKEVAARMIRRMLGEVEEIALEHFGLKLSDLLEKRELAQQQLGPRKICYDDALEEMREGDGAAKFQPGEIVWDICLEDWVEVVGGYDFYFSEADSGPFINVNDGKRCEGLLAYQVKDSAGEIFTAKAHTLRDKAGRKKYLRLVHSRN